MKKIWKQFWESLKESAIICWEKIQDLAKTTFEMFKETLITFINGFVAWLAALIDGVATITFELVRSFFDLLVTALKSTVGLMVEYIINWIKKW